MKAISIRQPWAELILQGRKRIEIRKWKTNYRGALLIHASKRVDREAMDYFRMDNLTTGAIVGAVYLDGIKVYSNAGEFLADRNLHLSFRKASRFPIYGFIFKNARRIKPIKCRGRLGLFEVKIKL